MSNIYLTSMQPVVIAELAAFMLLDNCKIGISLGKNVQILMKNFS